MHHWAGHSDLAQLECDSAGMAHHAGPDLDQLELQAGQRPVRHGHGQFDAAQEGGQIVGQRVQLQPDLVIVEPLARQPRPVEGVLAFLDMLLGGAALVIEPHHPVGLHRQVGDDEAHAGKQLTRMPFDLRGDPALLVPGCGLILEILVEPLYLGQRGSPYGPHQPVRDLLAQDGICGQPDGVEITCLFEACVDRRNGIGRIGPKEAQDVAIGISGDHRVQNLLPAVGAVDVAMPQGIAFQHAKLVEQEVRMIAANDRSCSRNARSRRTLPDRHGSG